MNLIQLATHTQNQLDQAVERIGTLAAEHAEAIKAKDVEIATFKQQATEFATYKAAMEAKVAAALQSGDPAQYEALAHEFLTPAQELERQSKLARIELLKAETAALEATI